MLEKAKTFAERGNGRRLLNTLNKKENTLSNIELDTILKTYRDVGLAKEVESLKQRRGILNAAQYDALAQAVRGTCSFEHLDDFLTALKKLLSCGMTMNPTKTDLDKLFDPAD